jgi:Peptidase MA superfamily
VPRFFTACAIAAGLVAVQAAGTAQPPTPPALQFETVDSRPADEPRLRGLDRDGLGSIVQLVGLEDPGPPIHVVLAPEDSEVARTTSSWIAGFAQGATGTVVLFPSRSLRYPHDSLEAVLRHEVAHVLIARAADGRDVPRWFNEGLAVVAERGWQFEDRWQLAWELGSAQPVRMDEVNDLFQAGPSGADRAYALASAFVRHVIETQGSDVPARILAAVASGASFEVAFEQETNRSLADAERSFHAELTSWTRQIPLLTSPFVLWMIVTLLALFAIYVRYRRSAERRRKWAEEEARDAGWVAEETLADETAPKGAQTPPRDWVH